MSSGTVEGDTLRLLNTVLGLYSPEGEEVHRLARVARSSKHVVASTRAGAALTGRCAAMYRITVRSKRGSDAVKAMLQRFYPGWGE